MTLIASDLAAIRHGNFHPDDLLADLCFEIVAIDSLTVEAGHVRKPGARALEKLSASISELGFVFPLVVDDRHRVIAGHLRLAAARTLGMSRIPVVRASGLSEAQFRLLRLADNKIPTLSDFDADLLRQEFRVIVDLNPEINFEAVGFDAGEIDIILDEGREADPDDVIPETDDDRPVLSRAGDIWLVGSHRLACGDARDVELIKALSDGVGAQAAFIDPPYNVPIEGHVSGLGKVKHAEFAMASGEMSRPAFIQFLTDSFVALASACADGAVLFVCMDWRHMGEVIDAADAAKLSLLNLCVWNKTNGGMGSLYRSQHELVFVLKKGDVPHTNNVKLGASGRYRTNVWTYPGANTFRKNRDADLADHPTVKPVLLVADALKDVTPRGGVVIDTFMGSGTSLIAAQRAGRRCLGVEIDPGFVDLALRRFKGRFPEVSVTLEGTGEAFDVVTDRRTSESLSELSHDDGTAIDWDLN